MTRTARRTRRSVPTLLSAGLALGLLAGSAAGQDDPGDPDGGGRPGPDFVIEGSGEGHGVGLSQWGARALARSGLDHDEILRHFYTGVEVGPHADAETTEPLRVGLFHANHRVDDAEVLQMTALRDAGDAGVDVSLAPGASAHRVTADETWTLAWEPGALLTPPGFVLRDADGGLVGRADGPVTVTYAGSGEPALRLPQLARGPAASEGAFLRGEITVTRAGDTLRLVPVMELGLEEYLLGVDEIPALWNLEALKAQAVAARTYAALRLASGEREACGCHVGVTSADQVYAGYAQEADAQRSAWGQAVVETAGEGVSAGGELIEAVYSAAHAGRSEHVEDSWAFGGSFRPYLRSVPDPWVSDPQLAAAYSRAAWRHRFVHEALAEVAGLTTVTQVRILQRTIGGTPRTVAVSGWDEGGERVTDRTVGGLLDVAGAELFLALRQRGDAPPSQQFGTIGFAAFDDVPDESPHAYNVAAVAAEGIAQGTGDRVFSPRDGVRRDQMASFLARALDLPVEPGGPDRFDDVPEGSVHRDAINAVAAAGIAEGVSPRLYAPATTVTRGQMASFLGRAFELGEDDEDHFTDTARSVHRTRINAVAAEGVTTGCTASRYCPRHPVTRDQMASFLARARGFGW